MKMDIDACCMNGLIDYLRVNYGSLCWRCIYLSDEFMIMRNGERLYYCAINGHYTENFIHLNMVSGCGGYRGRKSKIIEISV